MCRSEWIWTWQASSTWSPPRWHAIHDRGASRRQLNTSDASRRGLEIAEMSTNASDALVAQRIVSSVQPKQRGTKRFQSPVETSSLQEQRVTTTAVLAQHRLGEPGRKLGKVQSRIGETHVAEVDHAERGRLRPVDQHVTWL